MEQIILIDADQMMFMKTINEIEIKDKVINYINRICELANKKKFILIFSHKVSYRKIEFSSYKSNRKDIELPEFYHKIKKYIKDNYNVTEVYGEEADDVILYLKRNNPKKYIIASQDKDVLNAIAGKHINTHYYNFGWKDVTISDQMLFHYSQLLMGDKIDGVNRLKINDLIRERFDLTPKSVFSEKTSEKVLKLGLSQGMSYDQTVLTSYLLGGKTIEDYFNQIKLIYMGYRNMDVDIKVNVNKMLNIYEYDYDSDFILKFGKYKGKTLIWVLENNKSYVDWLLTQKNKSLNEKIMKIIGMGE